MISSQSIRSNAVGALISGLIYVIIDTSSGAKAATALWHAGVLCAAAFVVYCAVSMTVVTLKGRNG